MADQAQKQHAYDVGKQQVGAVYAKALLGALEKTGDAPAVLDEFGALVADVLDRFPDLDATLSSPRVAPKDKIRILDNILGKRMSEQLLTFLKVVSGRGRLDCLREICQAARNQYDRAMGRIEVGVKTASPIDRSTESLVKNVMRGVLKSEVMLKTSVDADLIGGMVVRVGDKVFDGSVANGLARLREETIEKTYQELRGDVSRFADSQ